MRTRSGRYRFRKLSDRGQNVAHITMFAKTDEGSDDAEEFATWDDTVIPTQSSIIGLMPTMTGWETVTHWAVGSVTYTVGGSNRTNVWVVTIPIDPEAKKCWEARVGDQPRPEDVS